MVSNVVIVGGGIAGVTCAKTLAFHKPELPITLISESPLIKTVVNLKYVGKMITTFDVEERLLNSLTADHPNIEVLQDGVIKINDKNQTIITKSNKILNYKLLCLCVGGSPKLIPQSDSLLVLGIRDTDSVECFIEKLKHSKRVAVVGNGGIASELVYKMHNVEIDWIVKDKHISATFVDPGAAEFFQASLVKTTSSQTPSVTRRMRYNEEGEGSGAALGPDWYKNLDVKGASTLPGSVNIHYGSEIEDIIPTKNGEFPLKISLTNSTEAIPCELVVSATGVKPNSNISTETSMLLSEDGGILINKRMQTSVPHVYAAGDVASPNWNYAKHWFPMKLWSQAVQMGTSAAQSMILELEKDDSDFVQNFCYELFTHSTSLFGYHVVLLGLYNGQKLGTNYEILLRTTPGKEYVKFVLENNRLQGAVLIGDTGLEETCENLILNQIDLSPYGDDILDPNIDIEDYFD